MHSHHGRPSEQKTAAPEEQGEQGDPGWEKMEARRVLQGQTRRTEGQAELGQTAMGGQGRALGECRELRRLGAQGKEPGSLDQEVALVTNGGDPVRGRMQGAVKRWLPWRPALREFGRRARRTARWGATTKGAVTRAGRGVKQSLGAMDRKGQFPGEHQGWRCPRRWAGRRGQAHASMRDGKEKQGKQEADTGRKTPTNWSRAPSEQGSPARL
ncbi:hypothetical protein Zm00014a_003701 [Zea mays]|jgi:hypothetical protein|uniref:Uncharacterized protein n=1 Tax=Zea mays TaxID=4577 RepID=A0A317YDN6_MAIZE|nr:hypothetical protein Zm00014a_003701 [Zea mays]